MGSHIRQPSISTGEGTIVAIRGISVVFAAVQTATFYRPFPPGVEATAWLVNGVFALSALLLAAGWWRVRRTDRSSLIAVWLGRTSMIVDLAFALAVTWIYAFDPDTVIWVVLYIVAIEGAYRFGLRGALTSMAVGAVGYALRDIWAEQRYGVELFWTSISFRMGVGFVIAAVAGAMAERYIREHRRLVVALAAERSAAVALRSLDELRSTFLAAVSHELRTPLTSILGFALTMQQRADELRPRTRVMLDQVVAESRHLELLLQDLLDIERMGRGSVVLQRHATDIAKITRGLVARIEQREGRRIDLEGADVTGVVDALKVERIIDNLVANAVKYSPEDAPVRVRIERSGNGVLLMVDDGGPGIPVSMRSSIFEPFERGEMTSGHQPGTGIGLSLVDRFARLHGGHAWVEDSAFPHGGASFRVYLPDGPEGPVAASVADEPWGGPGRGIPLAE